MEPAAYFLMDVRAANEYQAGHIPGSINLPLDEIQRVGTLVPDKNARIYLFCETGKHSGCARTVLLYLGYGQVWNLGTEAEAARFISEHLTHENLCD